MGQAEQCKLYSPSHKSLSKQTSPDFYRCNIQEWQFDLLVLDYHSEE